VRERKKRKEMEKDEEKRGEKKKDKKRMRDCDNFNSAKGGMRID